MLRIEACSCQLVKEQNTAAATQSQSKRKAEVAGGTTDNNDSYLKRAKSAQRIPKKSPHLVNTISRNDSPYFIDEGEYEGPMLHDPQKWPAPTAKIIEYFKAIPTLRRQSYRLAIWKVCWGSFLNPSRCRWTELKLQPRQAKGKGKPKRITITPLHLPWGKMELRSQTPPLGFSNVNHTFPLYELLKACHT